MEWAVSSRAKPQCFIAPGRAGGPKVKQARWDAREDTGNPRCVQVQKSGQGSPEGLPGARCTLPRVQLTTRVSAGPGGGRDGATSSLSTTRQGTQRL